MKPLEETIMPRMIMRFNIEDIGVEEASKFMGSCMERYGFTTELHSYSQPPRFSSQA